MLRPATDADMTSVLGWRNHPEVRRVSITQHEITLDEHLQWWNKTKRDPSRRVLIYERDGLPSGVVTFFDVDDKSAWWGYYLDNDGLEARGAMFPAWISIQREAVRYAREELELMELHGETLASNEAAIDFNARQKFEQVERYMREVGGRQVEVVHSRRIFEENK